ncbi:hypothetical protein HYALB_00003462 [Hymenoscyphus albidus]|uniref:F-box domain-containing protein n=1 Tax=Hymenoscyphus albidus TaxID=595503 RepID=A0A9N9LMB5_9HELO|nr:hypothetical protein HYALB_00003462 [Hymenoscyphus albidus]
MCSHWPDYEHTEDEDVDNEGTNDEDTKNEVTSKELFDFLTARDHKPRYVMFFVPKKFVYEPVLSGPLLRLLPELQLMVLSNLEYQKDQLCLAFTCIYFMRLLKPILREGPLYSSFGFNHFVFYGDNYQWVAECDICRESKLVFLEQLGPPIEQGRRRKGFQICMERMRYRPTRKSFWMAKADAGEFGDTNGSEGAKLRKSSRIDVAEWRSGDPNVLCPACRHFQKGG